MGQRGGGGWPVVGGTASISELGAMEGTAAGGAPRETVLLWGTDAMG